MTNPAHNEPSIDVLAADLEEAKQAELAAKKRREAIERNIVTLLGHKDEGVQHHEGGFYTISTTGVMNRTLDKSAILQMKEALPADVFNSIVTIDPKLKIKELKELAARDPKSYQVACRFFSVKPGKTKVDVKEAANDE
jgi:hypothetical protein